MKQKVWENGDKTFVNNEVKRCWREVRVMRTKNQVILCIGTDSHNQFNHYVYLKCTDKLNQKTKLIYIRKYNRHTYYTKCIN